MAFYRADVMISKLGQRTILISNSPTFLDWFISQKLLGNR